MPETFMIGDTHFGHRNIVKFTDKASDKPLRPWNTVEEMDEALVYNWNAAVSPKDRVFLLGDFVINRRAIPIAGRLNGRKILIKGNHDTFRAAEYLEYFEDLLGCKEFDGFILTHIPVHESQFGRWIGNIHGHLHSHTLPDSRYFCASAEQLAFTPAPWHWLKSQWREQNESHHT